MQIRRGMRKKRWCCGMPTNGWTVKASTTCLIRRPVQRRCTLLQPRATSRSWSEYYYYLQLPHPLLLGCCCCCRYCPGHAALAVLWTGSRTFSTILIGSDPYAKEGISSAKSGELSRNLGRWRAWVWNPEQTDPVLMFYCPGSFYLPWNLFWQWNGPIFWNFSCPGKVPYHGTSLAVYWLLVVKTSLVLECFLVLVTSSFPGTVNYFFSALNSSS